MANGAWLWKLGLWGLVILFGFLYMGSVERHRGDADRGPPVQSTPAVVSEAEVDDVDPGVAQPVAGPEERAAAAVETQAAIEPPGSSGSGAPVSPSREMVAGDAVEHADGGAASSAVSQAEARAFAKAVLSDDGAEVGRPAAPATAGKFPAPPTANPPIRETATEAAVAHTPAQPAVPSAGSETAPRSVEPVAAPVAASVPTPAAAQPQAVIDQPQAVPHLVAPSAPPIPAVVPRTDAAPIAQPAAAEAPAVSATVPAPPSAVPPSTDRRPSTADRAADATAAPARETAAQRRARIMVEYRAMQQAAWEEMRKRWSRPGGSSLYGAYPQWGYPQGYPPRWGQPPVSAPGD